MMREPLEGPDLIGIAYIHDQLQPWFFNGALAVESSQQVEICPKF